MDFRKMIADRRDQQPHSREELEFLAKGAADGSIPDYQLAAWLMAAVLNPLDDRNTSDLTLALASSGERLDLTGVPKPWVDKHSTGGVGDKTTIALLPILAACGLSVVKMSGRGLGITGGTIDKLEAIPGFRTDLAPQEMVRQAREIGLAITGQTPELAPADKALYALRDVTETVASLPLIVSSILSKKIAGGAESVVLDVKCGSGSFNKDQATADRLAKMLVAVGEQAGLRVKAAITDMEQPLGRMAGNALEIREALDVLTKPADALPLPTRRFRELVVYFAALTLVTCGASPQFAEAEQQVETALLLGTPILKLKAWFEAQGANVEAEAYDEWLEAAPVVRVLRAKQSGSLLRLDAQTIGEVVVELGGGRKTKNDALDLSVGIELHHSVGDSVSRDEPLATIHAGSAQAAAEALELLSRGIEIVDRPVGIRPVILRPAQL